MSTKKKVMGLVFSLLIAVSLIAADLVVLAQNQNANANMSNMNMSKPRSRKGRHRRPAKAMAADANMATGEATEANTNMAGGQAATSVRHGRCDPTQQEQTDLSGTYNGTVNYPDGGLQGDATLTITGNQFTLTSGSSTMTGRIAAVTTCGYTGATLMLGEVMMPKPGEAAPALIPTVSVRAKKMGDKLMLNSVPGEKRSFSFGSGGRRRRMKRMPPPAPAASPTPEIQ